MRILLTFIAITSLGLSAFGQQNLGPELKAPRSEDFILDSFYHWGWDTMNLDWKIQDRTRYTTNADQEVIQEISMVWNDTDQWTNSKLVTYTYDTDHHLTNEVTQLWNGTDWMNSGQNIYSFDVNQDQIGILYKAWDGTAWADSYQLIFTYDGDHNQLSRTSQLWNGTNWVNGTRQLNTYDGNHHLTLRLFQNYTSDWNDVSRSIYTYDIHDDLDTLLYQKWTFNAWNDDYRNLYDFDDHHNRILIQEQLAVGINFWQDQEKYEYAYDQFDLVTHLVNSNFENNMWVYNYQYNIINDGDQNRATEVFQNWDNEWVNSDSTQYYYTGITSIPDFFHPQEMHILPNPTNDFLFVEYSEPIDGTVAIYSATGSKLLEFKSNHEQTFLLNVSAYPPGVYFIALQVGHQVLTKGFEKM